MDLWTVGIKFLIRNVIFRDEMQCSWQQVAPILHFRMNAERGHPLGETESMNEVRDLVTAKTLIVVCLSTNVARPAKYFQHFLLF